MSIVMNERVFAENAIRDFDLGLKPTETLGILAKYYRSLGYKKSDIRKNLETFLLQCDPGISIVRWSEVIDTQVKMSEKRPLIEVAGIPITEKELELCTALESTRLQRLLFTLICLAKFANMSKDGNNNWVNRQDKEIFGLANVAVPLKHQAFMLNDLREMGYIRFSRKVDNVNINVTCLTDDDPILMVDDLRNLGNQFMMICGGPYFQCKSCGLVVRRGSNAQKYCRLCATEVNRKNARDSRHIPLS